MRHAKPVKKGYKVIKKHGRAWRKDGEKMEKGWRKDDPNSFLIASLLGERMDKGWTKDGQRMEKKSKNGN
ncbi:MAG: hypothetical protein M0P47_12685 [Bacteroidales bacterium]|nr:hypothetical protein [Bacteroidales bacterium]